MDIGLDVLHWKVITDIAVELTIVAVSRIA